MSSRKGLGARVLSLEDALAALKTPTTETSAPYTFVEQGPFRLSSPVTVVCPVHGVQSPRRLQALRYYGACVACSKIKAHAQWKTYEGVPLAEYLESVQHDRLSFSGQPYRHSKLGTHVIVKNKIAVECPDHGEWVTYAHSYQRHKCPRCSHQRISAERTGQPSWKKFSLSEVLALAVERHPGYDYSTIDSYENNQDEWPLVCQEHGPFVTTAFNVVWGGRNYPCPKCAAVAVSRPQQMLMAMLEPYRLLIDTDTRTQLGDRKEIDLYLRDYRVGVEVNGLYYHSQPVLDAATARSKHRDKARLAKKSKIRLLQFTDLELDTHPELIVSMILAACGVFKHRAYARQTEIVPVAAKDARTFLAANHLKGFVPGLVHLGAVNGNGTLCAVASFGESRFSKEAPYELLRFATTKHCQLVGGVSRLVAHFRRLHPGALLSYADLSYSQGRAYFESGFRFVRETPPNYVYWRGKETVSRYEAQKHKLASARFLDRVPFNPELSEYENMAANKWHRYFDAGNLLFVLE